MTLLESSGRPFQSLSPKTELSIIANPCGRGSLIAAVLMIPLPFQYPLARFSPDFTWLTVAAYVAACWADDGSTIMSLSLRSSLAVHALVPPAIARAAVSSVREPSAD